MAATMSPELAALCGQLEQWRKHGGGGPGKRIPEAVWQRAAAVARVDGVLATARATRLDLERLQVRVGVGATPRVAQRSSGRQDDGALVQGHVGWSL